VLSKLLDREVRDRARERERERERDPTIFFGSEHYGMALWAAAHPRVRQHPQHVHGVFAERREQQRGPALSFCHLLPGGPFGVLFAVQHLADAGTRRNTC